MSELAGAIASHSPGGIPTEYTLSLEALKSNKIIQETADQGRKFVSMGHLLEGVSVKIVDPDKLTAVAKDKIGEIWLAGNSVAKGYWRRDEETTQVFNSKLKGTKYKLF